MATLERLPAALSVLGTALVIGACISPRDQSETVEPAELDVAKVGVTSDRGDDVDAVADERASLAQGLALDEEEDEAERLGQVTSEGRRDRRCDRRDDFHCRRNHRGWRWVRSDDGRPGGWDDRRPGRPGFGSRRDRWCCVPRW